MTTTPRSRATRLEALARAAEFDIGPATCTQLVAYLDAMLDENARVNLTAIRDPDAALVLHALDSLAFTLCREHIDTTRVLDLGSGNGFPGVAVACTHPHSDVTLLDRTRRKIRAIDRALESSGLSPSDRLRAVHADATQAPASGLGDRHTLVTARAVAEPAEVGRLAAPLLRRGGTALLWLAADTPAPPRLGATFDRTCEVTYRLAATPTSQPQPGELQLERIRRVATYRKR